ELRIRQRQQPSDLPRDGVGDVKHAGARIVNERRLGARERIALDARYRPRNQGSSVPCGGVLAVSNVVGQRNVTAVERSVDKGDPVRCFASCVSSWYLTIHLQLCRVELAYQ